MNGEGRLHSAPATSPIIYSNCSRDLGEHPARCACGRLFPTSYYRDRHIRRDGCLGAREYSRLVRPRVRWQR